jgi:hypothetical protein
MKGVGSLELAAFKFFDDGGPLETTVHRRRLHGDGREAPVWLDAVRVLVCPSKENHRQERPLVSKTPSLPGSSRVSRRRAAGGIATSGLILVFFVRRLTRGRIEVAAPESTPVSIEPSRKQL